jgi:hypothetical protein
MTWTKSLYVFSTDAVFPRVFLTHSWLKPCMWNPWILRADYDGKLQRNLPHYSPEKHEGWVGYSKCLAVLWEQNHVLECSGCYLQRMLNVHISTTLKVSMIVSL